MRPSLVTLCCCLLALGATAQPGISEMQQAQQNAYAAPIGQQITWNNAQSGHSGTITPTRDGRDGAGNYCREFQQTINVGGQPQQGYGTACRQPDGSWKIAQ